MMEKYLIPHEQTYEQALKEVKNGKKETHWIWWIFPHLYNKSEIGRSFQFSNRAAIFLKYPMLGEHLIEITQAVLDNDKTPYEGMML